MLNKRLRELRKGTGLNQEEISKRFGVARTTYAMYEQGQRTPDYETLQKMADYFEVTTDYLLGRSDKPSYTAAEEKSEEDKELEKLLDDPNFSIAFKEFSESPEENREKALEFLRYLNSQKKKDQE
ncbi:helix-turn-helix domain-containing protein [Pontibacillus salicampi]|uniref:Helix-turn-helix domain-containing protein n=1 Tax=Pontibacillus salicampi TaxID=1449801 RepID=A0ABV6LTU2_9BACI